MSEIDYKKPLSRREVAKCLGQAMSIYGAIMAGLALLLVAGWAVHKVTWEIEGYRTSMPNVKKVYYEKVVR